MSGKIKNIVTDLIGLPHTYSVYQINDVYISSNLFDFIGIYNRYLS